MSEIRTASIDNEIEEFIDRGAQIKEQVETMQLELKGIKSKITDAVQLEEGEKSVRLAGNKAKVIVSEKERLSLDFQDSDEEFRKQHTNGDFDEFIDAEIIVPIEPNKIEAVLALLESMGLISFVEYSLDTKAYKNRTYQGDALDKVVKKTLSKSVKFEV